MLLYIILINYNGASDTAECVQSILNSRYKDVRIVIVDNNSCKESLDEIKKLESDNVKVLPQNTNLGFSGANNIGRDYALENGADAIIYLNNDTILSEDMLDLLIGKLSYGKVLCPRIMCYPDKEQVWYAGGYLNRKKGHFESFGYGQSLREDLLAEEDTELATGCCLMMDADTAKELGPWSEEYFLYREDDDYSLRIAQKGFSVRYVPQAVLYHKESASSKNTGSIVRNYYMTRNSFYLVQKFKLGFRARLYLFVETLGKSILRRDSIYLKAMSDYSHNKMGWQRNIPKR